MCRIGYCARALTHTMASFWKPGTSAPGGAERGDESTQIVDRKLAHLPLDGQRKALPIYRHRNSVLFALEKHRTVVVVGETGCGKTTQARLASAIRVDWTGRGLCFRYTQELIVVFRRFIGFSSCNLNSWVDILRREYAVLSVSCSNKPNGGA